MHGMIFKFTCKDNLHRTPNYNAMAIKKLS